MKNLNRVENTLNAKKMKTLKLNKLEKNCISRKEMHYLYGGAGCGCSCRYAGHGGSTTDANGNANKARGLYSPNSLFVWVNGVGWGPGGDIAVVNP